MIANQTINEQEASQNYLTMMEESDLLHRAQAHDASAFTLLCRMHLNSVYATCLRMLANEGEAKELTQEAMIHAWENIQSFRGESPFSAWLHRIAINAVLDHIRSRNRLTDKITFSDEVEQYEIGQAFTSPELSIDLEEAISLLPTQSRAVLVLHDIEGYRHNEISAMLGIAPGTSKAHLHHARCLLKEMLQ